jgi:hypothetical protein
MTRPEGNMKTVELFEVARMLNEAERFEDLDSSLVWDAVGTWHAVLGKILQRHHPAQRRKLSPHDEERFHVLIESFGPKLCSLLIDYAERHPDSPKIADLKKSFMAWKASMEKIWTS